MPESFVGVISDTHGMLRPQAVEALRGATAILHAGDVGGPEILTELEGLAPVTAVRGNMDFEPWASVLRRTEVLEVEGRKLFCVHDLADLGIDPRAAGLDVIVSGHTHRPEIRERGGVLFINPGSTGPGRGGRPPSLVRLFLRPNEVLHAELVPLGHVSGH